MKAQKNDTNDDQISPRTVKTLTQEFLENTTTHGIPRLLLERRKWRGVLWILVYLGFLAYCAYQTINLMKSYGVHDVNVKISIKHTDDVQFPAVTLCNLNKLKRSKVNGTVYANIIDIDESFADRIHEMGSYYDDADYYDDNQQSSDYSTNYHYWENGDALHDDYKDYSFDKFDSNDFYGLTDQYDFKTMLKMAKTDDLSDLGDLLRPNKSELDMYGHQLETFIIQCSFDKVDCNITEDFVRTYSDHYGNCYTFNAGMHGKSIKTTTKYGSRYGLRVALNIEPDEYLGMFSHSQGARIVVHPHNVTGFPEDDGISVHPGKNTQISIKTTSIHRQPPPYVSSCTTGEGYGLQYPGVYTSKNCQLSCLRKKIQELCNCEDSVYQIENKGRCSFTNASQVYCRQKTISLFQKKLLSCQKCPDPCSEVEYDYSVSMTDWPSDYFANLFLYKLQNNTNLDENSLNPDSVKKNFAQVQIFYKTLSAFSINEYPEYTFSRLLADFGGTLGLFIGASLCTVLEVVEYMLDLIVYVTIPQKIRQQFSIKPKGVNIQL